MELNVGPVLGLVGVFSTDPRQAFDAAENGQRTTLTGQIFQDGRHIFVAMLHQADRLVDEEDDPADCDVVLQIVSDGQLGDERNIHFAQVIRSSDAAQHQNLRAADGAGRQQHLLRGAHDVDAIVPIKLDGLGALCPRVDDDFEHMRVHGNVQVAAVANRSQERLAGRAARSSPDRSLRQHESRLAAPVAVQVLVAQFDTGLDESTGQRCPVRRFLDGQVTAASVVRRPPQIGIAVVF